MDATWENDLQSEAEHKLWNALQERTHTLEHVDIGLEYVDIGPCDASAGSSWGSNRSIRASIIKAIAMGESTYNPPMLRVRGARITGRLNLEAAHTVCPLDFRCCYFDEAISFEQADIPAIYLFECNVPGGIAGSQLHTRHNFYMDGSSFGAKVNLSSAKIDGQLSMEGVHLHKDAPLHADTITVSQGAYFSSMEAEGEVRFIGARIAVKFEMKGARLVAPQGGEALHCPRMQVDGNLFLSDDFHAEGTVDLTNATITGDLNCTGGHFKKGSVGEARERCLDLARVDVRQHIYLNGGFSACGTVYLADATIGGSLNCEGGTFENPADTAIYAPGIRVGRDVLFTKCTAAPGMDQSGFSAKGKVILSGARINAKLDCTGGRFLTDDERQEALQARGMTISSLTFDPNFLSQGVVDLRQTIIKGELTQFTSVDPAKVKFSGLTYKAFRERDDTDVTRQISWLRKVKYSSQIYQQLASTYAADGNEGAAKSILVAGREARRRNRKKPRRYKRYTELPLKWLVNYGYSPFRVLGAFAILWIFGGFWFAAFSNDMALAPIYLGRSVEAGGQSLGRSWHPEFQSWIYTADLLLPIIDLQQSEIWIPTHAAEWVSAALTISGWALATALIVGLGSVFRADNRKDDGLGR